MSLASASTWFGALMVIIIGLLLICVFLAASFGPIALVIAAIVGSFRNSTGVNVTTSSRSLAATRSLGDNFGEAFGATLQQSLGQQLGQSLAQIMAMAAAQDPLAVQLAPIVLAVDAARRQGEAASVRPFLTERFAARFTAPHGAAPTSAIISHMSLTDESTLAPGGHAVIRIDRVTGTSGHSEYWSFQQDSSVAPDGTPAKCPQCGAPYAGDYAGPCRFCGGTLPTTAPVLPRPTRWLLDDISGTPPALAA